MDLILESNWSQVIASPTRGKNTLDLLFSGSLESVIGINFLEPLGDSDHAMIVTNLSLTGEKPIFSSVPLRFDWNKADWVSSNSARSPKFE